MSNSSLILASQSFYRQELMKWLGLDFQAAPSHFDEYGVKFEPPEIEKFVKTLATGKAVTVLADFPEATIIGADTVVFFENEVIGKPQDLADASKILQQLSGHTHQVWTGLAIIPAGKIEEIRVLAITSDVTFYSLTDQQVNDFVQTGEPLNKAGAYSLSGGARSFLKELQGSFTNILGLPLIELAAELEKIGVEVPAGLAGRIEKYTGFTS